jgi:hypothetical protein
VTEGERFEKNLKLKVLNGIDQPLAGKMCYAYVVAGEVTYPLNYKPLLGGASSKELLFNQAALYSYDVTDPAAQS